MNFAGTAKEEAKLPEEATSLEGISGMAYQTLSPFSCCGPIVIDPHEVRWANLDVTDSAGAWGVVVQFKDDNPPVSFTGLDGRRVLRILQDAGKDVPDEQ